MKKLVTDKMSKNEREPLTNITEHEELNIVTSQTDKAATAKDITGEEITKIDDADKEAAGKDIANDGRRKKIGRSASEGPKSPPFIRAIQRGSSSTTLFFQERNLNKLDVTETDSYKRNVFHYAISKPHTLDKILKQFGETEKETSVKEALHQADIDGETPMHRAARIANTESLQILYEYDNTLIKDKTTGGKTSVLHLAIRSRSVVPVKFILSKEPNLLDCVDNSLQTPVHYAASLQQTMVMEHLIALGANTTQLDANNRMPIHIAASKGLRTNVELLLLEDPDVLDVVDDNEQSPLMLAAKNGFPSVVLYLLGKNADYKLKDKCGRTAFDWAIRRQLPEVIRAFLASNVWKEILYASYYGPEGCLVEIMKNMPEMGKVLLDRCVTTKGLKDHPDYQIIYDFCCLESRVEDKPDSCPRFEALKAMVANIDEGGICLCHPVAVKYVDLKWRKRGFKYNLVTILVTLVFHICLMLYTTRVIGVVSMHYERRENQRDNTTKRVPIRRGERPDAAEMMALRVIILTITSGAIIRELVQFSVQRRHYFIWSRHYVLYRLAMIITVMVYLLPVNQALTVRQLSFGAVAVLLSWVNLIQFLKVVPIFGIYIIVVQKVFWTLMKIVIVVLIYLLSFASTFYILLAENDSFRNIFISLVSTFVAMINSIDYDNLFVAVGQYEKTYELKMIILVLFLLSMSIVVNNALIGLAVGDTNEVMKFAKYDKFVRRAKFVILLERSVNKIPRLRSLGDKCLVEFPARKKTIWQAFWDVLYFGSKLDAVDGVVDEYDGEHEMEITFEEHIEQAVEIKLENLRSNLRHEFKEIHDQIEKDRKDLEEKINKIMEKLK